MDELTYATVIDVCMRLAGRLSDDILNSVREYYSAGEWGLAEDTLLLNLSYEGVGITRVEYDLIRTILYSTHEEPNLSDLDNVPIIDAVPPLPYRFSPTAPANAPDPSMVDTLLSTNALRYGGHHLYRAWREPLRSAKDGSKWVYVLQVSAGTDELSAYASLSSNLPIELPCQLEVVVEGGLLRPYQTAALTAAQMVWNCDSSQGYSPKSQAFSAKEGEDHNMQQDLIILISKIAAEITESVPVGTKISMDGNEYEVVEIPTNVDIEADRYLAVNSNRVFYNSPSKTWEYRFSSIQNSKEIHWFVKSADREDYLFFAHNWLRIIRAFRAEEDKIIKTLRLSFPIFLIKERCEQIINDPNSSDKEKEEARCTINLANQLEGKAML